MSSPDIASLKTFVKFMAWYAIAAGVDWALANLASLNMPVWSVPILAAALKAVATFLATKKAQR